MEEQKPIISVANYGNSICNGCGSFTPDGEPTGNLNIRHFRLHHDKSATVVTYCNECAAKVAFFLLEAWGEVGE